MNEQHLDTVAQLCAFLNGTQEVQFEPRGADAKRYAFTFAAGVGRLRYGSLPRPDKGVVMRYLQRTTGYSRARVATPRGSGALGRGARQTLYAAREGLCPHARKFKRK